MLERDGGEVARATSIVRYAPDSLFDPHTHGGGEGVPRAGRRVFRRARRLWPRMYVRNPPGHGIPRVAPKAAPSWSSCARWRPRSGLRPHRHHQDAVAAGGWLRARSCRCSSGQARRLRSGSSPPARALAATSTGARRSSCSRASWKTSRPLSQGCLAARPPGSAHRPSAGGRLLYVETGDLASLTSLWPHPFGRLEPGASRRPPGSRGRYFETVGAGGRLAQPAERRTLRNRNGGGARSPARTGRRPSRAPAPWHVPSWP